jgi:hypothetical protein
VRQRRFENRLIELAQHPHHGIRFLRVKPATEEERAEDRHQRHSDHGRGQYGERLGERERMKQLPFLARKREDGDKGQEDDGHREEDRAAHKPRRLQNGLPHTAAIAWVDAALFDVAKRVLGHDNARIDEHADRDCDACEAHDVR